MAVVSGALLVQPSVRPWEAVACLCFAWLLWVPLVRGVGLDWTSRDILRDVVPLGFLFLPLFLGDPRGRAPSRTLLPVLMPALCLALAGALFALRWWQDVDWVLSAIGRESVSAGYQHLLTSPALLFGALLFPLVVLVTVRASLQAGSGASGRWTRRLLLAAATAGALLCWSALAATVHRFALVAGGLALLALLGLELRRAPMVPVLAVGLAAAVWLALELPAGSIVAQVVLKSQVVGSNQRIAELSTVAAALQYDWTAWLFGQGWGALLDNPAVGGKTVSYTHNLMGYMLLKTGLLGSLAVGLYLTVLLAGPLLSLYAHRPAVLLVLAPCLVSGLLLHTGFKLLSFGVILWLTRAAATLPSTGPTRSPQLR